MSPDQILMRVVPLASAAALAWAWRSPGRAAHWAAVAAAAAALFCRADAPQAGLLLAAVALGSAVAMLVGPRTDNPLATRAALTGMAAALAAAVSPGALDLAAVGNAIVEPAALLRGAVAAATWATAISLPSGPAVAWLAVGLLWLPWGLPGHAAPQVVGFAATPLEEGAALARVGAHGLPGLSESPWQGWSAVGAAALATALVGAAAAGRIRRPQPWLWSLPLLLGAALAGYSWIGAQADLLAWRPLGLAHGQALAEPWSWDLGPWALQLWRWTAVAVLLAQAAPVSAADLVERRASASVLGTLTAAAVLVLLGWWAVAAPDRLGPGWVEDPAVWAAAAALAAGAAARTTGGAAAGAWAGPVAAVQWLVALAIAGGGRSGGAVFGLLP